MAKIAYIIYSLSNSAGMERSLTTRANFLLLLSGKPFPHIKVKG